MFLAALTRRVAAKMDYMRKNANKRHDARTVCFRPSQSLLGAVTAWMAHRNDLPSLSEAISRLVELGLASDTHQDRQKRRARKMAGDTIDGIGDMATTADNRASARAI
ncbi:hypothetical protein [Bradyrhizobium sp. Rc3b]|uniref:hypothetical protein n=1 Tax=Bradyrhizobium sp. Rc3b TaxID=1855322 RepID=UPI000B87A992|nr:hypothetical protein [Bradyrhizobium sp. Rc3b]